MPQPSEPNEIDQMGQVDADGRVHRPTEANEGQVLRELYGEPDEDGVYRGEEA